MTFEETRFQRLLPTVIGLLQGKKRVTYRTLKYVSGFDEARLAEIKEALRLIGVARNEDGKVLVWTGEIPPMNRPVPHIPSVPDKAETRMLSNGFESLARRSGRLALLPGPRPPVRSLEWSSFRKIRWRRR